MMSAVVSPQGSDILGGITLRNWELGKKGEELTCKGRIVKCIYLMHLWYEMNFKDGIIVDKVCRTDEIERFEQNINKYRSPQEPYICRQKIYSDQRMGGRFLQLKNIFGWSILLFDISSYRIRDASNLSFRGLLEYIGENPSSYNELEMKINNCISPDEARQLVAKVVTEASKCSNLTEALLSNIDSVDHFFSSFIDEDV